MAATGSFFARRRPDLIAIGTLLVALLILFAPVLRHPDYLVYPTFSPYSDLTVIHWPKAKLMAESWQSSRTLPLWTPANLSGMPLAANQLAMRFYPPALLFLFLPINLAFNILYIFHLLVGGLGAYLLVRIGYCADPVPALSSALAFALGGKLLAHAAGGHASLVGAVAWMPWALLGMDRLLYAQHRAGAVHWSWACLAGAALAMQVATHTLITLYTAYFLVGYLVWHQVSNINFSFSRLKSLYLPLLSIPLMAGLLGAAQLLPVAELAGYSNRSLSLEQASEFALTPSTLLIGLFVPTGRGGHEMVIYLGLVPMVIAFFGLGRADRRTWFLGAMLVLTLVFALGTNTPLFEMAYRWLPGFRWVRTPARAFLPASLAVAVLAGVGLQRLTRCELRWPALGALTLGLLTLGLGIGLAILFRQINRATLGLAILPSLTLLLVRLAIGRKPAARLALPGLALLIFLDMATFGSTLVRFASLKDAFGDGKEAAEYLASRTGLFRTYSPSYSLPSHVAARAGLQTADGVEPVHLAAYDEFMALAGGYGDAGFSVTIPPFPPGRPLREAFRSVPPNLRLLGLLNVEYLAAAFPMEWPGLTFVDQVEGTYVYRNQYALPRAWIIHPVSNTKTGLEWQLDALAEQSEQAVRTGEARAQVTIYQPDYIEIEAWSSEEGVLVLSEMWYPGWRAKVDGKEQPIERVAGIFRSVSLTPGTHTIVFSYEPESVRWGRWMSRAGWLGIVVVGILPGISRSLRQRKGWL